MPHSNRPICLVAVLTVMLTAATHALALDEDEDFLPGLDAVYSQADSTVQRIDPTINFDWGTAAPDIRLGAAAFQARWSGNVIVRQPGSYRVAAEVSGSVSVTLGDKTVLHVASETRRFVSSEPFELAVGDQPLVVEYSAPENARADRVIRLFWVSDGFTLEPLPVNALFRDLPTPELNAAAVGYRLADALRCAACHNTNSAGITPLPAPSLERVAGSRTHASLIQKIMSPHADNVDSRMPTFGLSQDDASAIAAYLLGRSKKAHEEKVDDLQRGDADAGHRLLKTVGCVACHRMGEFAPSTDYAAPDLTHARDRRSDEWLTRWLRDPASLNPDHQMPKFELSKDERRQMVAALRVGFGGDETANPELHAQASPAEADRDAAIQRGKALVSEFRCASCHSIPGIEGPAKALTAISALALNGPLNCIRTTGGAIPANAEIDIVHMPRFRLTDDHRSALTTWLTSIGQPLSTSSQFDHGQLLLHRNGCVSCHDRDNSRGLSRLASRLIKGDSSLSGQSESLIPPSLSAVGDKLNDEYLNTAIFGKQKEPRLPWLRVRMPTFNHSDADAAAIRHFLISADRIPDEADSLRSELIASINHGVSELDSLVTGNALVGAAGFNCVACHKAGPWEPRNVAMGTRGSDILSMNQRLRPRFFQRWMRGPVRIVPGMEMPTIRKGVPGILDDSLDKQLGVMWTALNNPKFKAPADVSSVEQLLIVAADEPPQIVRDVFTIGADSDDHAIARAFAVGFPNGHSVLFDLDRFAIRQWTVGEFARQRTEGKSWFWDMSGVSVAEIVSPEHTFRLMTPQTGSEGAPPLPDQRTDGSLIDYSVDTQTNSVILEYAIRFPTQAAERLLKDFNDDLSQLPAEAFTEVRIRETWKPLQLERQSGWSRSIAAIDLKESQRLMVAMPTLGETFPAGFISLPNASGDGVARFPGAEKQLLSQESPNTTWEFRTSLPTTALQPKPRPPIIREIADIDTIPGFKATRLPLDTSIMPTAMTWLDDGRMAFTSLRGHVWIAEDTDGDGLEDELSLFEEGLAAPFGILQDGESIIVAHKPEVIRLTDTDGDGRADHREVIASGWGYTDNYHDWTSGLVRADNGDLFVALGSDYSQPKRPENTRRWRGGIVRIQSGGRVEPVASSMRFPMGLAIDSKQRLFATDNQGVQNTFNEINHIIPGHAYGVPSRAEAELDLENETPAIQIPHPWTRSVNAIAFLPSDFPIPEFAGQAVGCEYDTRCLIRLSFDDAGYDEADPDAHPLQGAAYRLSTPADEVVDNNLVGPICIGISPTGDIHIGSIFDSGWLGGRNTGAIARLTPDPATLPVGISEVTATADGFRVRFCGHPDDTLRERIAQPDAWDIRGYTRDWEGSYATPDSGQHRIEITSCRWEHNSLEISASTARKPGHVYEVRCTAGTETGKALWPDAGHYTMKSLPN